MSVRQQIIEDQVDRVAGQLRISTDEAFLRLSHALLVGRSVLEFDEDDVVDGGQDKQIDVITIEEDDSGADVWILQAKHSPGFSSNALIQMRNGLLWLFDKPKQEYNALKNQAFKDKIQEFRAVRTDRSPSNLRLHVAFATVGSTKDDIGEEFEQELRTIRDAYSGDLYGSFEVNAYGPDELLSLLNTQERRSRSIDADLRILYDVNTGSMISHNVQGLKGLVCTIPAQEIARLVNNDTSGSVFDLNLRRFLGGHGAVNKDIMETCSNAEVSHEFWFLNNGITNQKTCWHTHGNAVG